MSLSSERTSRTSYRAVAGPAWPARERGRTLAQPYPLPRAVAIGHDTQRVLRQLALARNSPNVEPWGQDGHRFILQDAAGRTLTESPFTPGVRIRVCQHVGLFAAGAGAFAGAARAGDPLIDQHRGYTLEALSDDGSGVTVTIRAHTGLPRFPTEKFAPYERPTSSAATEPTALSAPCSGWR